MQEDPVLLTPEDYKTKPYVAIIKVIYTLQISIFFFPKYMKNLSEVTC